MCRVKVSLTVSKSGAVVPVVSNVPKVAADAGGTSTVLPVEPLNVMTTSPTE